MSQLEELLERIRAAKGADREIDGDIAAAFEIAPSHLPRVTDVGRSWLWADFVPPDDWETWEAPAFTASIDAALALVERVLPGWRLTLRQMSSQWRATMMDAGCSPGMTLMLGFSTAEFAPTAPLAILAALLSALIAQRKIDADKN